VGTSGFGRKRPVRFPVIVAVRRVHVQPTYRGAPYHENDITLLILAAPALVPPAPLATECELLDAGEVVLAGFGRNDPQRPLGFGLKRWTTIPLRPTMRRPGQGDTSQFEQKLGFHADYEFVCGRKGLGKDSCNGDSGGPAYIRSGGDFRLAGLTSRATREAAVNSGDGASTCGRSASALGSTRLCRPRGCHRSSGSGGCDLRVAQRWLRATVTVGSTDRQFDWRPGHSQAGELPAIDANSSLFPPKNSLVFSLGKFSSD
jgi:Trypsin